MLTLGGLVPTSDTYTRHLTREQPGTELVNLYVYNAPVFWQWMDETNVWVEPEVYQPPGERSFERRCRGVRVRSALAGKPAVVNLELLGAWDRPRG